MKTGFERNQHLLVAHPRPVVSQTANVFKLLIKFFYLFAARPVVSQSRPEHFRLDLNRRSMHFRLVQNTLQELCLLLHDLSDVAYRGVNCRMDLMCLQLKLRLRKLLLQLLELFLLLGRRSFSTSTKELEARDSGCRVWHWALHADLGSNWRNRRGGSYIGSCSNHYL